MAGGVRKWGKGKGTRRGRSKGEADGSLERAIPRLSSRSTKSLTLNHVMAGIGAAADEGRAVFTCSSLHPYSIFDIMELLAAP